MSKYIKAAVAIACTVGLAFIALMAWMIIYGMLRGFYTPVDSWTNEAWAWTMGVLFFMLIIAGFLALIGWFRT